jgi:Fe-S cluster assembly protein SufD
MRRAANLSPPSTLDLEHRMQEKPRIVVSRTHHPETKPQGFAFTQADLPPSTGAIEAYRRRAWSAFERLAIPDVTQEAWRRTDLRAMPAASFHLPGAGELRGLPSVSPELLKPLVADQHGGQIVLSPESVAVDLDPSLAERGVVFTDLRTAQLKSPEVVERILGQTVNVEEGKFAALAGALASNGVLLYVPKNLVVEQPLHSVLWGPGSGLAHLSHLLVMIDEGASVTFVHESSSPTEAGDALHAGLVEIRVCSGASLKFVELQSWGRHVWNFTHERVHLERDAQLDWIFGAVGSKVTKNFSELDLAGEGAAGRMSGFYFTDGTQHLDHDTQQNHLAPHTTSDFLFKGALRGHSRSVWQGMIYVAKGAEKTDGYQANRNLILDDGARADSIPGLEILADDVRCTHGATVGKLEEEPLFYLKSRGIPPLEAARLVVEGFFDPIMQRIPFEGVRERFQQAILQKMS